MLFIRRFRRLFAGRPSRARLEHDLAEQVRRTAQAMADEEAMARKLCDHVMRLRECERMLGVSNGSVAKQIDAIVDLNAELTELRGELAAAERERDELRERMDALLRRTSAAPGASAPMDVEAAKRTLREARHRTDVWDAVAVLLDQEAWGAFHAAGEPSLGDAQTKWYLGAASAVQSFKLLLGDIVAAPDDDAEAAPPPG